VSLFSETNINPEMEFRIWTRFMLAFDHLPLAAIINGNYFAVHGGLSPKLMKTKQFHHFKRY
jgi:serine/threonine-protein phosphatase 2B catalytic subunit